MPGAPATPLLDGSDVLDQMTCHLIAGGMPRQLEACAGGTLAPTTSSDSGFRFVQRYPPELESGADPAAHVQANILPHLAEHTASVFEEALTTWMRSRYPGAAEVSVWWGSALNPLRARKERFTDEVDTVVLRGKSMEAAAEAAWTTKPKSADLLTDLIRNVTLTSS
ncbi:MAG: DUF234 domain-containing protein [Actinomycetota bacterium]|nr:DUF234 domain-containing protein [Actinomycetota bacterium]